MADIFVFFLRGSDRWFSPSWWVRTITGSEWGHVCVGDEHVVQDHGLSGTTMVPLSFFAENGPADMLAIRVRTTAQPGTGFRVFPVPTMRQISLAYATHRLFPVNDCVSATLQLLSENGIDVPPNLRCPQDVYEWLTWKGYRDDAPTERHSGSGS